MSVLVFEQKVAAFEAVKENDRVWFPRWVRRYALAQRGGVDAGLPVNQHSVISFSRSLLDSGAPAWQRWQAVRAVECYRDLVLERTVETGTDIQTVQKLMGHKDIETTMRYIHIHPKLGETVMSPVDTLPMAKQ